MLLADCSKSMRYKETFSFESMKRLHRNAARQMRSLFGETIFRCSQTAQLAEKVVYPMSRLIAETFCKKSKTAFEVRNSNLELSAEHWVVLSQYRSEGQSFCSDGHPNSDNQNAQTELSINRIRCLFLFAFLRIVKSRSGFILKYSTKTRKRWACRIGYKTERENEKESKKFPFPKSSASL